MQWVEDIQKSSSEGFEGSKSINMQEKYII